MPYDAALKTPSPEPELSTAPRTATRGLDVKAQAALAEAAAAALSESPGHRRGPMRPKRLVTTRERLSGASAVRLFRLADLAVAATLAYAFAEASAATPLMQTALGDVAPFAVGGLATLWAAKAFDSYRLGRAESLRAHQGKLALAGLFALIVTLGAAWTVGDSGTAGRAAAFVVALWGALHLTHLRWWTLVRRWREEGKLTPNVLLVGATKHAETLIRRAMADRDMNVLGVFDDRLARAPRDVAGVPVLGDTAALMCHRLTPFVDRVVVAVDPSAKARVRELVERLRALPNEVSLVVDVDENALARAGDAPLARVSGGSDDERRAFAKRVQDLVIGGAALLLATPAMLLVALAIKLDSPGPVFFRQRRHGFNNEEILVWKFRSMRVEDADARAERQVTADDDRVTRVGRIIRKTSLDELPQLFNVLKGEMSLVGPRPHAIGMKTAGDESARLVAEYAWRHRIKPGMTGWAAIHGSRGPLHTADDVKRRVALDVEYVERQSLWLDLKIMARTLPCLLGDRDAVR